MTDTVPRPRRTRALTSDTRREPNPVEELGASNVQEPAPAPPAARRAGPAALRPISPTPTYIGVAVTALGFALLAVAWGGVAGEDNVALQVPYLVSGGLAGIGLILVGLTVVNVAAKRRDAALRQQQIEVLAAALQELRGSS